MYLPTFQGTIEGLTIVSQQDVEPSIAEPAPLIGKLAQTGTQLRVWRPSVTDSTVSNFRRPM
jgi:hypothetical protein